VIYIKQSLGRLSALCGCVVAATGSSCGITWLMGGSYKQVAFATHNATAIGSVHPIAGITSRCIKAIICFLSDSVICPRFIFCTKVGNILL
jgi:L-cysteine desulfidase